ncbi:MAG: hypothetical protein GY822_14220 [Deltaproteobacteria bacterium]|nr:hypothetical protein [Deltaproteobacteria bacterium]
MPEDEFMRIKLVNPKLTQMPGVCLNIQRYDIFSKWKGQKVDLVLAANILNRTHFTDAQIILALQNLVGALKNGGCLVIVDNRAVEGGSIFRLSSGVLDLEQEIGCGTDICELVRDLKIGASNPANPEV